MTDIFRFRISGQAGYEIDCGDHMKTRIVFAIFDEDKSKLAWYMFSSTLNAKAQGQCAKAKDPSNDRFAFHDIAASNPAVFRKKISVGALLSNNKGTPATLNMDTSDRGMNADFSKLKTSAGEIVNLGASLQLDHKPSNPNVDIAGKVYFLELVDFDADKFKLGPQGKASAIAITGPNL